MQETQIRPLSGEDPLEEENGNRLQYSCLKNPKDRGIWGARVQRVAKSGHDWAIKWASKESNDCDYATMILCLGLMWLHVLGRKLRKGILGKRCLNKYLIVWLWRGEHCKTWRIKGSRQWGALSKNKQDILGELLQWPWPWRPNPVVAVGTAGRQKACSTFKTT